MRKNTIDETISFQPVKVNNRIDGQSYAGSIDFAEYLSLNEQDRAFLME